MATRKGRGTSRQLCPKARFFANAQNDKCQGGQVALSRGARVGRLDHGDEDEAQDHEQGAEAER